MDEQALISTMQRFAQDPAGMRAQQPAPPVEPYASPPAWLSGTVPAPLPPISWSAPPVLRPWYDPRVLPFERWAPPESVNRLLEQLREPLWPAPPTWKPNRFVPPSVFDIEPVRGELYEYPPQLQFVPPTIPRSFEYWLPRELRPPLPRHRPMTEEERELLWQLRELDYPLG